MQWTNPLCNPHCTTQQYNCTPTHSHTLTLYSSASNVWGRLKHKTKWLPQSTSWCAENWFVFHSAPWQVLALGCIAWLKYEFIFIYFFFICHKHLGLTKLLDAIDDLWQVLRAERKTVKNIWSTGTWMRTMTCIAGLTNTPQCVREYFCVIVSAVSVVIF